MVQENLIEKGGCTKMDDENPIKGGVDSTK